MWAMGARLGRVAARRSYVAVNEACRARSGSSRHRPAGVTARDDQRAPSPAAAGIVACGVVGGGAAGDDCCTITTAASRRKFRLWGSGAASRLMWITRHSTKGLHSHSIRPSDPPLRVVSRYARHLGVGKSARLPNKEAFHRRCTRPLVSGFSIVMTCSCLLGTASRGPPQALRLSRAPP